MRMIGLPSLCSVAGHLSARQASCYGGLGRKEGCAPTAIPVWLDERPDLAWAIDILHPWPGASWPSPKRVRDDARSRDRLARRPPVVVPERGRAKADRFPRSPAIDST